MVRVVHPPHTNVLLNAYLLTIPTTLSSIELKNILGFFDSTCLATLDNVVSSLQVKKPEPRITEGLAHSPWQVMERGLNLGTRGLKAGSALP